MIRALGYYLNTWYCIYSINYDSSMLLSIHPRFSYLCKYWVLNSSFGNDQCAIQRYIMIVIFLPQKCMHKQFLSNFGKICIYKYTYYASCMSTEIDICKIYIPMLLLFNFYQISYSLGWLLFYAMKSRESHEADGIVKM